MAVRNGPRRVWVLVALVAALAVAVLMIAYVIWGGPADESSKRTAIVASVLGIVGAVSPVVVWARSKRRRAASVSTSAQVEAAAELLAVRTSATWSKELVRRGIEAPAPVRVRWRWAGEDVAVPLQELASSSSRSSDPEPLPASSGGGPQTRQVLNSGLVTRLHDEVYSRLRHGRLVLIGGPGAGKTGAMILLLMEVLQQRDHLQGPDRAGVPVPVWLTLGSWDPTSHGLREWVLETMARDYPYLRAEDFGPDAIGQLFDTGRTALFLDGLDEMPDAHRARAVELLTAETAGLRVTLTSRPDQYRATLVAGWQLPFTAVVELHPVGPRAAARYLLDGQVGSARQGWQQVTDRLEADPDGVLARTLNTPLTLSLARSAYAGRDPVELMSRGLESEQALRGHLLDQVLVTAYPDSRRRAHAAYWLGWVADQMNTQPTGATRDLRWWEIARWTFRWRRQLLGSIVGGLVYAIGIMLIMLTKAETDYLLIARYALAIVVGLAIGLLVALMVGHSGGIGPSTAKRRPVQLESQPDRSKRTSGLFFGVAAGLPAGLLTFGLWGALNWEQWRRQLSYVADLGLAFGLYVITEGLAFGLAMGSLAGIAFGLVVGRSDRDPQAMVVRLPTAQDLRRGRLRIVVGGLPAGLGIGLLNFLTVEPDTALSLLLVVVATLAFGLSFGFMLWLLSDVWHLPIAAAADATPRFIYRKDVQTQFISGLVFGFMGGLITELAYALTSLVNLERGLDFQGWVTDVLLWGPLLALVVGLVLGLIGGLRNGAASLLMCTEAALALRGRPVRFIPLLESARDRQVLRQAGAVYQFRHADLQDRLADRYRTGHA